MPPPEQIQLASAIKASRLTTQRCLGSELNLTDAACDRFGIRLEAADGWERVF